MKTYVTAALIALAGFTFHAQAQVSVGVRGGINFFNINGKDNNGNKLDNRIKTGYELGLNIEAPLGNDFYLQPGLLFVDKGGKSRNVNNESLKFNLNYIELPVNVLYKPELGHGKLLLGAGPYIALGVGGNVKNDALGTKSDVKFSSSVDNNSTAFYYRPIDAGIGLLFGYEFSNRVSVQLNAELGLVNNNVYGDGTSYKNTGFGFSLGYRFAR